MLVLRSDAPAGERKFAIRIAAVNGCGYATAAAIATYIDARIPSHERWGQRIYPYGYHLALFAVPIALATYEGLSRSTTRGAKCFACAIPLIIGVGASVPVFLPEIPHNGFSGAVGMYILASVIACWIRYTLKDLDFIGDQTIPVPARIEAVKGIMAIWQGTALATVGGALGFLAPWVSANLRNNETIVRTRADLFLLNSYSWIQAALISGAYLVGPIREVFVRVSTTPLLFEQIRESSKDSGGEDSGR